MIVQADALPVGSAIRLGWESAPGIKATRILRRLDNNFAGPDDANAVKVFEGADASPILDIMVSDGQIYYYKDYGFDGAAWQDDSAAPKGATPNALYQEGTLDLRKFLKARLEAGFRQEIARGLLPLKVPQGRDAAVKVLLAPPDLRQTDWPVVSVHLDSDVPAERAVGEDVTGMGDDQSEGWLAMPVLAIEAWSQNPDERHELYKSVRRILLANLPVFDALGMVNVEFDAKDADFQPPGSPWQIPVYCASFGFKCKLATFVYTDPDYVFINDVNVTAIAFTNAAIGNLP